MGGRNESISIADDDRARIPFAVIAVLLLISSVAIVATLQSRPEPEVNADPSLAIDRTNAAVQTALRDATIDALRDAASEPVTEPADTPAGRALAPDASSLDEADPDAVFTRYVKLRIYLTAQDRIERAGQDVRGARTSVSLDEPVDADRAIDSVTLHVGGDDLDYGDSGGDDLEHGKVRATIEDVRITVERDGETIARRTEDVEVTVGSTVFELHHLTTRYERQLNTDLGHSSGFGRHFAARMYRLGWTRGYAQHDGAPVAEILADRHVETLANDAMYATQRDVFGNDDPRSDRKLTRAWTCTLARDAHRVYDSPTGGGTSVDAVLDRVDEDGFCDGLNATYDDIGGDLSDPPDWTELAPENTYLEATDRIDLNETATAVLGEVEANDEVQAAIDRTYAVDVAVEDEIERDVIPGAPEGEDDDDWTATSVDPSETQDHHAWVERKERVVDPSDTANDRALYEFDVVFVGEYEGTVEWTDGRTTRTETLDAFSVRYDATFTVRGEYGRDSGVERKGIVDDYAPGSGDRGDALFDTNFETVPERAVVESIAGVDSVRDAEEQLEAHLQDRGDDVDTKADLADVVTVGDGTTTIEPEPVDPERLRGWLIQDLEDLENDVANVSEAYDRHEMVRGDAPLRAIRDEIDDEDEWEYARVEGDHYANAADRARAELRRTYMERLRERVDRVVDEHNDRLGNIDGEIRSHSGANLTETTAFAREQFDGEPYRPTPELGDHELLSEVTFTPAGAPSYLTFDRVNASQVPPAGEPPHGFAPLAGRHENVYAAPYDASDVHLRTAGEVLEAGKAADSLIADADWDDGDVEELNESLENEVDAIVRRTARDAAEPFPHLSRRDIEPALRDEVASLGPVETQAIRLGEGGLAIDRVAENVSRSVGAPPHAEYDYYYADYYAHLESAIRYELDDAAGEAAVADHTARLTRSLGRSVRRNVTERYSDAIEQRLTQASEDSLANASPTAAGESWLRSDLEEGRPAPNRVSSGLTTPDRPKWNALTTNLWNVHLAGEYARFTVHSSSGTPPADSGGRTSYVRENGTVSLEIAGSDRTVGHTEKLAFESRTTLLIAVPSDGLGVGDRTVDPVECSETYDATGPIETEREFDSCGSG